MPVIHPVSDLANKTAEIEEICIKNQKLVLKLLQSTGVGDSCFWFIDGQGNSEEFNHRAAGSALAELPQKEKSILIAGGARKIEAIRVALVSHYANRLVTDKFMAKALLE